MFYDNFLRLCNEKNEAPTAVGKKLSIHPSQISRWANTGAQPRRTNLLKIADYFGVSVDDLLKDIVRERPENEKKPTGIGELSEVELSLIKLFRALPEDRRTMVLPMLEAALKAAGLSQVQE